MDLAHDSEPSVSWTWADLLSTYRYWGLFLPFVLSVAAAELYHNLVFPHYQDLSFDHLGGIETLTQICWILLAPLVVWIAIRTQPVRVLAVVAGLAAASSLVCLVPAVNASVCVGLTDLFIPLFSASFLIGLPVLLAGTRGGRHAVLVGFGVAWISGKLLAAGLTVLTGLAIPRFGAFFVILEISALSILSLIALLPIALDQSSLDLPANDQVHVNNYRFWGPFIAFVPSMAATLIFLNFADQRYAQAGLENLERIHFFTQIIWILLAPVVVWIAIRTRPIRVLTITATLACGAWAASLIPAIPVGVSVVLAAIFIPLMSATLLIGLPVLIAGARGGCQAVLNGFGAAWVCGMLLATGLTVFTGSLVQKFGLTFFSLEISALLLLTLIVLLPMGWEYVSADLRWRRHSFAPVKRDPLVTALLCLFVPFYVVYWAYRIHGEWAYVKPSPRLLAPRAAAWLSAIPVLSAVLFPIMLSTLADHHNELAAESGAVPVQRPWVVFLWSIVFWPVAAGMTQARLNLLMANLARSAAKSFDDAMQPEVYRTIHQVQPLEAEFIPEERERAALSR